VLVLVLVLVLLDAVTGSALRGSSGFSISTTSSAFVPDVAVGGRFPTDGVLPFYAGAD
jgi:hypothetical protein